MRGNIFRRGKHTPDPDYWTKIVYRSPFLQTYSEGCNLISSHSESRPKVRQSRKVNDREYFGLRYNYGWSPTPGVSYFLSPVVGYRTLVWYGRQVTGFSLLGKVVSDSPESSTRTEVVWTSLTPEQVVEQQNVLVLVFWVNWVRVWRLYVFDVYIYQSPLHSESLSIDYIKKRDLFNFSSKFYKFQW